jgi:hypothetical protein
LADRRADWSRIIRPSERFITATSSLALSVRHGAKTARSGQLLGKPALQSAAGDRRWPPGLVEFFQEAAEGLRGSDRPEAVASLSMPMRLQPSSFIRKGPRGREYPAKPHPQVGHPVRIRDQIRYSYHRHSSDR